MSPPLLHKVAFFLCYEASSPVTKSFLLLNLSWPIGVSLAQLSLRQAQRPVPHVWGSCRAMNSTPAEECCGSWSVASTGSTTGTARLGILPSHELNACRRMLWQLGRSQSLPKRPTQPIPCFVIFIQSTDYEILPSRSPRQRFVTR